MHLLKAENMGLHRGRIPILDQISFTLKTGESMAITGPSGSGKTTLGQVIAGLRSTTHGTLSTRPDLRRLMIQQQDQFFAQTGERSTYYGQRYENQGMDICPTVRDFLQKRTDRPIDATLSQLEMEHIASRKLLQLSNGERKRTQLADALLQTPDLLVLDQPFTGLDTHARANLTAVLTRLMNSEISMIFICDPESVPQSVDYILELDQGTLSQFIRKEHYEPASEADESPAASDEALFDLLPPPDESFRQIVCMKNVGVKLNGNQILEGINWEIRPGEQWVLQGHNGAGKSTLLSLITADNPQGYTNNLILFDHRRGSGESIWDIKKRIGFVSPELHLYFLRGRGFAGPEPNLDQSDKEVHDTLSCMEVITSGIHDEIGFSSPANDHQLRIARTWLNILQLTHLSERLFIHASLGEQRVLLLARALIKSPSLLILDEPCQGLDAGQIRRFTRLLNRICTRLHTTLIYVTHRDEQIPACANKRLMLENGHILSEKPE